MENKRDKITKALLIIVLAVLLFIVKHPQFQVSILPLRFNLGFAGTVIAWILLIIGVSMLIKVFWKPKPKEQIEKENSQANNKKNLYKNVAGLIIILAITSYTLWSLRAETLVLGKWENGRETIRVNKGNAFVITGTEPNLSGRYQLLEKGKASVNLDGIGAIVGTAMLDYKVSVSDLELYDGKNRTTYRRTDSPNFVVKIIAAIMR